MTLNTKPQMDVVRREDKEGRLKAFIRDYLGGRAVAAAAMPWLLVARSSESPVIHAIGSLAAEIKSAGFDVKTLIASTAPAVADSAAVVSLGFEVEDEKAKEIVDKELMLPIISDVQRKLRSYTVEELQSQGLQDSLPLILKREIKPYFHEIKLRNVYLSKFLIQ